MTEDSRRARDFLEEVWEGVRRSRKFALVMGRAIVYVLMIEVALLGVLYLTIYNALDWKLIISLVVAEVPIGVFLSVLLGERRSRWYRRIELFDAMGRFSHLRMHYSQSWLNADYPELLYFVVNDRSGRAYRVQEGLHDLALDGIIRRQPKYQDQRELERFFAVNGIQVLDRTATLEELGLGRGYILED
jgi:hypothetical protein